MFLRMKWVRFAVGLCAGFMAAGPSQAAPFTYQGQLKHEGVPVNGPTAMRFTLWSEAGDPIGSPIVINPVEVKNGLFNVELDFGGGFFTGDPRLLQAEVGDGLGGYILLEPRQPLNPVPYATFALSCPNNGGDGFWAASSNHIYKLNSGNVGIGTTDPEQALHVVGRVLAETSGIPIRGIKQGSGTFPGVFGETESQSSGASGVRGFVNSTTPGAMSAGVWGRNFGTTSNGFGIRGSHDGAGAGVFGEAASASGFGGYFEGRGYFSGNVGIGTLNPTNPLHVSGDQNGNAIRSAGTLSVAKGLDAPGTGVRVTRTVVTSPFPLTRTLEIDGTGIDGFATLGDAAVNINATSAGNVSLAFGGGNVGVGTTNPAVRLHVTGGTGAAPHGGGFLVLGNTTGTNISMDNDDIMARNNGQPSTLFLNRQGGDIVCGGAIDIGYEIVSGPSPVSCPAGKKAIGGGCVTTGSDAEKKAIRRTRPRSNGAGWTCDHMDTGEQFTTTPTAYAICARVK